MSVKTLAKLSEQTPAMLNDFFKPWNNWIDNGFFNGRMLTIPAVNISETKDDYLISLAAPGMKREDFNVDVEGNMITISCEKEEKKETKVERYNRREYNYSAFCRSLTLPEDVNKDIIDAYYEEGVLKVVLPKKDEVKKTALNKHIAVK